MTTNTSLKASQIGRNQGVQLDAQERGAEWPYLPAALGFLTGLTNIIGVLVLGGFSSEIVTSDMTGFASGLAPGRHSPLLLLQILAIPFFFAGIICVYLLARRFRPDSTTTIRTVLLTQFLLLAFVCAFSESLPHAPALNSASAMIIGLSTMLIIAVSNMSMHLLDSQSATTWAMTANSVRASIALLNIATKSGTEQELVQDRQLFHAIWPVMACYLIGVFGGTLSFSCWHGKAWFIPATISLLILLLMKKKTLSPQQLQKFQQEQQTKTNDNPPTTKKRGQTHE